MGRQLFESLLDKCVISEEDLIDLVAGRPRARIQTLNLHHFALAKRTGSFADVTKAADYVTADGWPIVSALRGLGLQTDRVTGSEFTQRLFTDSRLRDLRIGLLGAAETVGSDFDKKLSAAGVKLVFREHGSRSEWIPKAISEALSSASVDLLLVAVTPPFGDEIGNAIHEAGFPGTVMAVGGAVDMVVGARKAAPSLIRSLNVEWVFRLAQEPRRLFSRYILLCLPVFVTDVLPLALRGLPRK
ncbi:N-acetylglucosaminyldiphosphoundecaprenol N-acetyl-beta-D-mannosaminyltransferase [Arthrobacter sp. PvP102]|uniref:WecB/TagA/CpsF family glycosyltransferase n=1 Tax=unclassified Arthrobacter TaxID=235627 RepID=UPI001AE1D36E|nr:N-acetylglucosaminyldiphosphoundecaprenol N-acetyl-beta-D-mannosaminyltransferase [Arthrobacter sp. PvP103]MBP1237649.1 N-acetylglucosaminyldiphosphoundecaprenol N-acetyl-beta-D-mannosaminyltransferase [Arthrobacter sp. PvP102]